MVCIYARQLEAIKMSYEKCWQIKFWNSGEFSFETKSRVAAVRWKYNKDMTLLSTFYNPKDVVFVTREKERWTNRDSVLPRSG